MRKASRAVVSKAVVRAQNESRRCRALLLPPGQRPAQLLLQRERGASKARRSRCGSGPCPALLAAGCPRWLCESWGRGEKFGERPRSWEEVINGGACDCRYLVTPGLVLETPLILQCFSFLNLAFD